MIALGCDHGGFELMQEVIAHFKNPAMPSIAMSADAAIKIASAREGFASTDTFLEMIGFDKASIRRIKAQEARARGVSMLNDLEDEINGTINSMG